MKHLALVCTGLLVPVVTIVFSYATPNPTPFLMVEARTPAPFHSEDPPPPVPTPSVVKQIAIMSEIWIKPVAGPIPNAFGNGYPFYGIYRGGHTGVDIKAKIGTPVRAVAPGIVRYVRHTPNMRYGFYVVIEHPKSRLFSLYGHMQTIKVALGQKVIQGQQVGTIGTTGAASYPHLHFEVLNKMPIRDGAWGYYYICSNPKDKSKINYLQSHSKKIDFIQRMYAGRCQNTTRVDITYYNPEHFFPAEEGLENALAEGEPPPHEPLGLTQSVVPIQPPPLQETPLPYPSKKPVATPRPSATPKPTATPIAGPTSTTHPGLPFAPRRHRH